MGDWDIATAEKVDPWAPVKPKNSDPWAVADAHEPLSFPSKLGHMVNAALDPIAESPVVSGTMATLGQRPELQPLSATPEIGPSSPVSGPMDAIQAGAEAAGDTLALPSRVGTTLQMPQMVAQGKTTDYLISKGANKYVALAAGMIAGNVADPVNIMAATEIGAGINASIKGRAALKARLLQNDLDSAVGIAKSMGVDEAPRLQEWLKDRDILNRNAPEPAPMMPEGMRVNQSQLRSAAIDAKTKELNALGQPTGSAGPTQFKELAIPEGESKPGLLKTQTGPEVPQYTQKMTNLKTGDSSLIRGSQGMELDQPRVIGMHETKPVAGKTSFEDVTIQPKENRILAPEGYQPTRPETREIPNVHQKPGEVQPAGGTYGEIIHKEGDISRLGPSKPTLQDFSEQTAHMETPISTEYYVNDAPKSLKQWMASGVKELDDLNSSRELAAPTLDPHQDLAGIVRRYIGHQELARFDASKMTDEFAGYIPDRNRRTLVTLYSQLGRSPTIEELNTLRVGLGKVKSAGAKALSETAGKLMEQNLSLTKQEGLALGAYNSYFEGMGQNAQKIGVLDQLKDIYGGPHIYEPVADAEKGFFRKLVTGQSKFAQARTFDNVIEAVKNGYVPKTLDSAELLSMYHNGISKAASERYLMDTLEKKGLINYEGDGRQIKGFQSGGLKIKDEIYKKVPYSPNPEVQKVMSRIAEDPVLDYPIVRGIEKLNNLQKLGSLYLQVFHPKALAAEAIGKGFSPAKFSEGMGLIDKNPEYVRGMIRSGLDVNVIADIGKELGSTATKDYKGVNPVALARKANSIYTDWVFGKYMTGLKVWNANVVAKRFMDMGLAPERAMELAVEDSNRVFGGLNLGLMNRSPNMQRLFHMLAFAPDWTESRARTITSAFGRGIGDVTGRERALVAAESRRYWVRTLALAATTHLAGQINPFEKVLSVDLSAESGFKDTVKLAKLFGLDFTYFSSKMAAVPRTMKDFMDPNLTTERKFKSLMMQPLPISVQNIIKNIGAEE